MPRQQIENLFSDNITLNIDVVASTDPSFVGQSSASGAGGFSYSTVRSDLMASGKTSIDSTAYANLPASPDPTGGEQLCSFHGPAEGLRDSSRPTRRASTGYFTFSTTAATYSFDPNNRAVPGERDFIGLAEHEITEDMGRYEGLSPASYKRIRSFSLHGPGRAKPEYDRQRRLFLRSTAA